MKARHYTVETKGISWEETKINAENTKIHMDLLYP